MEEEIRLILARAVAAPENLGDLALQHFGREHGVELAIPRREVQDPLNFDR